MNKEQQQIIDEAYENYCTEYENGTHLIGTGLLWMTKETKDTFIYRSKTDTEFSEKWGLKIEERELSFKERRDLSYEYAIKNNAIPLCIDAYGEKGIPKYMETINNTGWDIPTRLITITYNDKTIESYE
jgi:hypothetical protein